MLILIRHAEAGEAERDEQRPLTSRGRNDALLLGEFLAASGVLRRASIWHSQLLRARETAELIVSRACGSKAPNLREVDGFAPGDPPEDIIARLAAQKGDLAVVGHNPHLTALATLLVKGAETRVPLLAFEKCAALALGKVGSGGAGEWYVCWHLAPELLRGGS